MDKNNSVRLKCTVFCCVSAMMGHITQHGSAQHSTKVSRVHIEIIIILDIRDVPAREIGWGGNSFILLFVSVWHSSLILASFFFVYRRCSLPLSLLFATSMRGLSVLLPLARFFKLPAKPIYREIIRCWQRTGYIIIDCISKYYYCYGIQYVRTHHEPHTTHPTYSISRMDVVHGCRRIKQICVQNTFERHL